jgi:hypothetical protein
MTLTTEELKTMYRTLSNLIAESLVATKMLETFNAMSPVKRAGEFMELMIQGVEEMLKRLEAEDEIHVGISERRGNFIINMLSIPFDWIDSRLEINQTDLLYGIGVLCSKDKGLKTYIVSSIQKVENENSNMDDEFGEVSFNEL